VPGDQGLQTAAALEGVKRWTRILSLYTVPPNIRETSLPGRREAGMIHPNKPFFEVAHALALIADRSSRGANQQKRFFPARKARIEIAQIYPGPSHE